MPPKGKSIKDACRETDEEAEKLFGDDDNIF